MNLNLRLLINFAEVMAQRGGQDWFKCSRVAKKETGAPPTLARASTIFVRQAGTVGNSPIVCVDDTPPSPEQTLTRKRKAGRVEGACSVAQKAKKAMTEPTYSTEERALPLGMWDPGFDLWHKIEFNFDATEEKVMSEMLEKQMSEFLLDNLLRGAATAFKMAYASNRGYVRNEVEHLKKQLEKANVAHAGCAEKQAKATKIISKGHLIMENLKKAAAELKDERGRLANDLKVVEKTIADLTSERDNLQKERDDLQGAMQGWKNTEEEMLAAICSEHTRGFQKALRQMAHLAKVSPKGLGFDIEQDMYGGRMVSIDDIPDGAFTADCDPVTKEEGTIAEEEGMVAEEATHDEVIPGDQNVVI